MTVLERVLRDFKFHLPSTPIRELTINPAIIAGPDSALQELLSMHVDEQWLQHKQDADDFAARFKEQHGVGIRFADAAIHALVAESDASGKTIRSVCEQKFKDYQYGLKLVAKNTGVETFEIDERAVADPDGTLSEQVLASYNR